MKTSEFMDKKVMDPSSISAQKDGFSFFSPNYDQESDDEFDAAEGSYGFHVHRPLEAFPPHSSLLRSGTSMDHIDSVEVTREEVGRRLLHQINLAMKDHFDKVSHSVDGLGARLSQLEIKINHVENSVDSLKVSAEYGNGKTDGKLRQLENILREVQEGINFIKDKQEIAETQLQLAKLQVQKGNRESQDNDTVIRIEPVLQPSSSGPEKSRLPVSSSVPSSYHPNAIPTGAAIASQVHSPVPQNPLPPINPPPQSYNLPSAIPETTYQHYNVPSATSEATYQQYNVPSATSATTPPQYNVPSATSETSYQQYNVPSETSQTPYQQYNVPLATSETSYKEYNVPSARHPPVTPPGNYQPPQFHSPSGSFYSQDQPLWSHHPEENPPMPSHNYQQTSSLPPVRPLAQQFHTDSSSQQMHGQSSQRPFPEYPSAYPHAVQQSSFDHLLPYGGSPSHYSSSTMNPPQLSPSSSVSGGGSNYSKLPRARILPDALPTASIVESGSISGGTGNKNPVDEIVDKVAAMGFRRDLARATIKKLKDDGQAVDLNVVLDKLMNG